MTDPLAHVAFALAAGNGTIDAHPARSLVAAGLALLQRCAPLVRALHGRRSALLLSPGAAWVTAMAASEGRCAVLIDPALSHESIAAALRGHDVGVVFTTEASVPSLPRITPHVVLDAAPFRATWYAADGMARTVDLATHDGLQLEGDPEVEGRADEAWRFAATNTPAVSMTHRDVLGGARAFVAEARLAPRDHALALGADVSVEALVYGVVAPLLAGARVSTARPASGGAEYPLAPNGPVWTDADLTGAIAALEGAGVSLMVAGAATYEALLAALAQRAVPLDAPVLQRCIAAGGTPDTLAGLAARWRDVTGVPLLQRRPHDAT